VYIEDVPKLIDHGARGIEITEAAWRVLVRDGMRAVSVRNVAAEAGLATASLRRTFPTQADLLAACLMLVGDRVEARMRTHQSVADPVERALAVLGETLPLDDRRRQEMHVYLTLGTAALSDPTLNDAYRAISGDLLALCEFVVDWLVPRLEPDPRQQSAMHLCALVDGLALHTLHGADPDRTVRTLRAHLRHLAVSETQSNNVSLRARRQRA